MKKSIDNNALTTIDEVMDTEFLESEIDSICSDNYFDIIQSNTCDNMEVAFGIHMEIENELWQIKMTL